MISIKPFLESDPEGMPTLLRVLHILLKGISKHTFEYDAELTARFRQSIDDIRASFDDSRSKTDMLFLGGAVVQALEDQTHNAKAYWERREAEFGKLVTMLSETVRCISATGSQNLVCLREIEQLVTSARETSDISVIKVRLGNCLAEIRKEANRQKVEIERNTKLFSTEIQKQTGLEPEPAGLDPIARLPSREAAEAAIAESCFSGKVFYIAVLVLEHLQLYNIRFGRTAGDKILRHFAISLRSAFPSSDALFRWGGPTFVGVLERAAAPDDVRSEVRRALDKVPSISVESEGRSVLVSIASRWSIFPATPPAQAVTKRIDIFASVHSASGGSALPTALADDFKSPLQFERFDGERTSK